MRPIESLGRLCMSCLAEMSEGARFCQVCGFDNDEPASPHQLPPRTILAGKYMAGRVLGSGGFGITYLGYDINLDIKVAIKEYFPMGFVTRETTYSYSVSPMTERDGERYENGKQKFLKEARTLAKLHKLNGVVEVRDFFLENGTAYIVMEYVEGKTLAAELKNAPGGRLDAQEAIASVAPLIQSLGKIHETGLIHRDISPDNIMRDTGGELKLLDFGAARDFTNDNKSVSVMLKPGYAPEEQYRTHGEQGPWTDCYALSATIYKLITGKTPQESLERLVSDELTPPAKLGVNITRDQNSALMTGLALRPDSRFRNMTAFYNALYGAHGLPARLPKAAPQMDEREPLPAHEQEDTMTNPPPDAPVYAEEGATVAPVNARDTTRRRRYLHRK